MYFTEVYKKVASEGWYTEGPETCELAHKEQRNRKRYTVHI